MIVSTGMVAIATKKMVSHWEHQRPSGQGGGSTVRPSIRAVKAGGPG